MFSKPRVGVVLGTRPEAIKLAPLIKAMREGPGPIDSLIISTGQHRQMLDSILSVFGLSPDIDLDLMRPDQRLNDLNCRILGSMQKVLDDQRLDLLVVQGDTTTAFGASLAGYYNKVPTAHVEAGLRSHDLYDPYPEEANRRLISTLAEIHFAPTDLAKRNLIEEQVDEKKIVVTGNTVIDALQGMVDQSRMPLDFPVEDFSRHRMLLVTSHRRESWGKQLENICLALKDIVRRFPDVMIVYPVHLNPNVQNTVQSILKGIDRVFLVPPVDYLSFLHLMKHAYMILSDSGGVTEEAPALGKPLLLLRKVTERPEGCLAGVSQIVGTSRRAIVTCATRLLTDPVAYRKMTTPENPYGDGQAANRIVQAITRWFQKDRPLLTLAEQFNSGSR